MFDLHLWYQKMCAGRFEKGTTRREIRTNLSEIKHRHMHMHWHVMKAVWSNLMFGKEGKLVWMDDRAAYTRVRRGE